jgi:hypothetical protein
VFPESFRQNVFSYVWTPYANPIHTTVDFLKTLRQEQAWEESDKDPLVESEVLERHNCPQSVFSY